MRERVLVFGYGNPGRIDDGLGPAFAMAIATRGIPDVTVETAYQLQIEVATLAAGHDVVLFVDAHTSCPEPFELKRIEPRAGAGFTTHSVAPEMLLGLAHEHFDGAPEGYVLGIRGYEFDGFDERMTPRARENLVAALERVERALLDDHPFSLFAGCASERSGSHV